LLCWRDSAAAGNQGTHVPEVSPDLASARIRGEESPTTGRAERPMSRSLVQGTLHVVPGFYLLQINSVSKRLARRHFCRRATNGEED